MRQWLTERDLTEWFPIYQNKHCIGLSDGRKIASSTHRPTVLYWRLSDFYFTVIPLPTFMYHSKAITRGHNQMTCKSASCTKHTTCDFVQKRKKKEVYCTGTVCLFGNLLFTYFLIASSALVLVILKITFYWILWNAPLSTRQGSWNKFSDSHKTFLLSVKLLKSQKVF